MKKIKLDTSLEKENMSMKNIIMEDDNNEAKMEDVILKVSETGDYENLHELSSGISFEAGNLRQPEISSENEETLLHTAAKFGYMKSIEILIKYGANLEARDKLGCTALHLASLNGHYSCVKLLLEAGADYSVPVDKTFSLTGMTYLEGSTPLHLASTHKNVNCVKLLIQFGANCEAVDINGHTSLYIAAKAGYSEIVLTHLRYAHSSSFLSLPSYDISSTPLHFAVKNGMLKCVKELVHLGSNVNHINKYGFSPLHLAYHTNILLPLQTRIQILKILVLEGHNPDMNNALHQNLFSNCCSEAKVFLITHGANINIKNERSGLTFLEQELCDGENFDVIKCIINSMLQVPHLALLDVYPITFSIPQEIMISEGLVFSKDVDLRIVIGGGEYMYIELIDVILEDMQDFEYIDENPVKSFSIFSDIKRVPLKQPLLNVVYEHINNELKKLNRGYDNGKVEDIDVRELMLKDELSKQKQMLYYEIMASTPRTLKHCCRFSIRKCMSPSNLLNINKLPLPNQLLSYLFFECDE